MEVHSWDERCQCNCWTGSKPKTSLHPVLITSSEKGGAAWNSANWFVDKIQLSIPPSCNPNTMLHTYFLLGMIVHVCTHRSRPHPCTQSRKTGWVGRTSTPSAWAVLGFWLKNSECKCTQQWHIPIHTYTLIVFCVVSNYKSTYLQYYG